MNYEVKSVAPGSVFFNALRIFIVVGLVIAIIEFFVVPTPKIVLPSLWQKVGATLLFTGVYSLILTVFLWLISLQYNLWVQKFEFMAFFMKELLIFLVVSFFLGIIYNFAGTSDKTFWEKCLGVVLFTLIFDPAISLFLAGSTGILNAIFGDFKGVAIHLEQD